MASEGKTPDFTTPLINPRTLALSGSGGATASAAGSPIPSPGTASYWSDHVCITASHSTKTNCAALGRGVNRAAFASLPTLERFFTLFNPETDESIDLLESPPPSLAGQKVFLCLEANFSHPDGPFVPSLDYLLKDRELQDALAEATEVKVYLFSSSEAWLRSLRELKIYFLSTPNAFGPATMHDIIFVKKGAPYAKGLKYLQGASTPSIVENYDYCPLTCELPPGSTCFGTLLANSPIPTTPITSPRKLLQRPPSPITTPSREPHSKGVAAAPTPTSGMRPAPPSLTCADTAPAGCGEAKGVASPSHDCPTAVMNCLARLAVGSSRVGPKETDASSVESTS